MVVKRVQHGPHAGDTECRDRVLRFLDGTLRQNSGFSVREEYPSVFGDFPGGESVYVEQGGEVVCHAAFLIRELCSANLRMKVGLIGSVVTAPTFRGQGMAKAVLDETLAELHRQGCVLAVLWSDQPAFYRPLGFFRAGRERDLRFSADSVGPADGTVREVDALRDGHLIWRLYGRHEVHLDRSLEEQKRLLKVPKARTFVTEQEGKITSYLVIHKGADFADYIHEWGGDRDELCRNVALVQREVFPDRSLTMIFPAHYDLGALSSWAVRNWDGVLGLVKILDKGKLLAIYGQYLGHAPAVNALSSDETILAQVLGVEGERPSERPLPFFLWGFDSI